MKGKLTYSYSPANPNGEPPERRACLLARDEQHFIKLVLSLGRGADSEKESLVEKLVEDANRGAASSDLLAAAKKMWEFYEDLSKSNPGFMSKLVLKDYARWNEVLTELPRAIAEAEKL